MAKKILGDEMYNEEYEVKNAKCDSEINYQSNKQNKKLLIILVVIIVVILGMIVFWRLKLVNNDFSIKDFSEYHSFILVINYEPSDETYGFTSTNKVDMNSELIYIEDTSLSITNKYWFDYKNGIKYSYDNTFECWIDKEWDISSYENFGDYVIDSFTLFSFIDRAESGEDAEKISDTEYLLTISNNDEKNEYNVMFDKDGYLEKIVLNKEKFIYTILLTDINEVDSLSLPNNIDYKSDEYKKEELLSVIDDYFSNVVISVNSMEYGNLANSSVLWYIPVSDISNSTCVLLDDGGSDPFGNWVEAYVVVHYNANTYSYEYYFTFIDDAGYGMLLTRNIDISTSSIVNPVPSTIEKDNITKQNKIDNIEYEIVVLNVDNGCKVS